MLSNLNLLFSFQFTLVLMHLGFASTFLHSSTTWYSLLGNKFYSLWEELLHRAVLEENVSCWIQQPETGEAAAAPCAQVNLSWGWRYIPSRHMHTKHTCTLHLYIHSYNIYIHGQTHRSQTLRALTWTQTAPTTSSFSPFWLGRMDVH